MKLWLDLIDDSNVKLCFSFSGCIFINKYGVDPTNFFSLLMKIFSIFVTKLGHFKERTYFSYVTNTLAKQQKLEN